jgi:GH25 family lysozyme M1 (1,4-beta-N-acetylmuramidase)
MADDLSIPNVFGWDASDYDWQRGPMDLAAAARDGIQFFTHKATEATSTRHRNYGEAMRRARDAGIPVLGAYHVVRSAPSVASQVDYFLSYLDSQTPWWRDWPDFFVQVDLEKWSYDKVPAHIGESFADLVEQRSGRRAVIYASRGQYGNELSGTSHLLWNANYGTNPDMHFRSAYAFRGGDSGPGWVSYSGRIPTFWQYGSRTTIGSQTICDANAFRGTLDQMRALISGDVEMFEQADRNTAQADTWRLLTILEGRPAAEYHLTGEPAPRVEPNNLQKQLDRIEAKGGVTLTAADLAAIVAGVANELRPAILALGADINAKTRDAVADGLEGGSAQVRADAE